MRSILDVFSRTWFINVILAVCVVFFGAKSIGVWAEKRDGIKTLQVVAEKTKASSIKKVTREKMSQEVAYGVVVDRNLFSPDRAEFVEEKETLAEVEAAPVMEDIKISGKKIVLYGVIMMDDQRTALISDFKSKTSPKQSMWVKETDIIGDPKEGVVVSSIQKESITLRKGGKKYEILLYEEGKPREKVAAPKETNPTVVTTTKQTAVARPPVPAERPESENAAPSNATEKDNLPEGGEYEMVDTPFGKTKVRKK